MPVTLHLTCGGCDATIETAPIRRTFHGFNGNRHGFGRYSEPDLYAAVEPTGWLLFDLINCTYCPECRKGLEANSEAAE